VPLGMEVGLGPGDRIFGQMLIFWGLAPLPIRAKFDALEQTHGIRLWPNSITLSCYSEPARELTA